MNTPNQTASATAVTLPLDPVPETVLGRLYVHWREHRGDAALPPFRSIRPEDLRFMLGRINLVDVLDAPLRFRYRLVGTTIAKVGAIDMQGQLVANLKPPFYARMIEGQFATVFASGEPALFSITIARGPVSRTYQRIVLPYAADPAAGTIGTLMTGTWFTGDLETVLGHPDFMNAEHD